MYYLQSGKYFFSSAQAMSALLRSKGKGKDGVGKEI